MNLIEKRMQNVVTNAGMPLCCGGYCIGNFVARRIKPGIILNYQML